MSFDYDMASNIYAIAGTDNDGAAASGSIRFSANPSANDTITLNGTAITFKASGATGNQVNISGVDLAGTLASLLTFLNASTDAQIVKCTYATTASSLLVTNKTVGTAGNAYTLAASAATVSGATLAGGLNIESATTDPAYAAAVNADTYYAWQSCTFVAFNETALAYSSAVWRVQDSDDGSTYADVDATLLVNPQPASLATTARCFQIGYVGKKKYVQAAFNAGANGPPWQVITILGHPLDAPLFQSAITGIEE